MKKIVSFLSVCFIIAMTGCAGYSSNECYNAVQKKYPNGDVRVIPGKMYMFLVKTENGDIVYVETMNVTNTEITQEFIAFKHDK